ncbi:hypothetical protein ACG2LH_12755 [Zhouia sp. PK063]|uniref:hypothetical protein n=1 Tax=Zhouia sp. PK063 TaxID=3373602 RepID=UPI0037A0C5AD
MLSKRAKHITSILFLATFLFINVAGLHGLTHKDDDANAIKNCKWCHISIANTLTPALQSNPTIDFSPILLVKKTEAVVNHYTSVHSEKPLTCLIFNKPPPQKFIS